MALAISTASLAAQGQEAAPTSVPPPAAPAAAPTEAPAVVAPPPPADKGVSSTPVAPPAEEKEKPKSKWRGTVAFIDQSASTQTLGIGKDFQSANNVYELWLAIKPKYYLFDSKTSNLSLNLWANFFLELTNSDATTTSQEPVVGPTWLYATYQYIPIDRGGARTTLSIGPRFTLPTEKATRSMGTLIVAGVSGGLMQTFPLAGKSAKSLNGGRIGISGIFDKPLTRG